MTGRDLESFAKPGEYASDTGDLVVGVLANALQIPIVIITSLVSYLIIKIKIVSIFL